MITTGHVQCFNSDSDVSSKVAQQKKPNSAPYSSVDCAVAVTEALTKIKIPTT